jgi:arsenate reductase
MQNIELLPSLKSTIEKVQAQPILEERKQTLQVLINYIQEKVDIKETAHLNFICTHNSRRSQFSQIWAQTAADYFGILVQCYSGGVEVTAFNSRAVASIKRSGFNAMVEEQESANPTYKLRYQAQGKAITAFSKLFDDPINNSSAFAAIMTCAHADDNCPYIPGAESRIPVRYDDPKAFDDTPLEAEKYDERSLQIASEMFYVFSQIQLPA